ncbi:energy transducer TonB [Brenneria goodwinii]|uniref:energy transducer TonB n=1 Tax=Brenneria goodwinii TaxID=1109412 RepID=UPI0036E370AD
MTQVIYAGEPEYSWQKTTTVPAASAPNGSLAAPRAGLTGAYWPGRWLALLLVLALHAAVLLLLQRSATPPLITPPRQLPISIELAAAPEAAEPVAQAPSVPPPEEKTPPVVDENALKPPPPVEKPRPPAKVAEKTTPKPPEKKRPEKTVRPANKTPAAPVPQTTTNNAISQPSQPVTPPLANADYLHNPAPEYPEVAISRGQEGTVLLNVQVGPDGKVLSVRLQKSSGYAALDKAAQDTVRRWSFVPARRGSQAVSGSVIVPIDFSLDS